MIFLKPSFYDAFECIGSRCTDNCCIGWEIDVDDVTLEKYKKIDGAFGERLNNNLIHVDGGSVCFRLCENERCAFLNKDNLCDIILSCGENHLCDICREHPRFYEWFAGVTECGLGLCCEEVCRLLIESEGFTLLEYNDGEEVVLDTKQEIAESDTYIFLSAFREGLFDILADDSVALEDKLVKLLSKTEAFTGEKIKLKKDMALLAEYMKTEPIDQLWITFIESMNKDIDVISGFADSSFFERYNQRYSKLLSYMLYRHMIKAVFDGAVADRVRFCVESLRFIMLADAKTILASGVLDTDACINNIKLWSKQVEYSEENTLLLIFGDEING